ncbi:alpha-L-fucosidase [Asticcacaulis sp. ZE23SCel15]|uniref:alpha-L-fucosidase n=1 Tax=Asticcacaulis sp. ZE23SCel15 TaxID=3059027 RepID=UPI00265EA0F9|nr:alpha-L-fucosidase [Asticcacaulis sp. ZE23SCel15]WKL58884.1 alpha-L-fucosidase [Asticcacaulis sp. ZE23SCel15]
MTTTRRDLLATGSALTAAAMAPASHAKPVTFKSTWESLSENYQTPDWFKDAKLGIWAHWGPQCVPEAGDWYGRQMYMQGNFYYDHHVKHYGHPSKTGFLDIIGQWKADKWQPETLTKLYKAAGAKYIVAMANHHDNLDLYNSKYHAWNSVRVGPKKDIVGTWEKLVKAQGLRFGVSNHSAHAWHWWQTAYGYDAEGPLQGVRYDAFRLTKKDGKGTWWDGLDPQELYTGPAEGMVPPDGITSIKDMQAFNDKTSGEWTEDQPKNNPYYAKQWLARQNDLMDKYRPDFVYMDNYVTPLAGVGLEATAYLYNQSTKWHGKNEAVVTGNKLDSIQAKALTNNVERGASAYLRPEYWQTCTCIGNWHYDRALYERDGYKSAKNVIQLLTDAVSKNGNLLLSIPIRGNGEIDEKEVAILEDMAAWMAVNGEAIFGTRAWHTFGEGPTEVGAGHQNEAAAKPFTAQDIRFTTKDGALYALAQDWPENQQMLITTFAKNTLTSKATIERVELLGIAQPLEFELSPDGLNVKLPAQRPAATPVLKITGQTLV